MRRAASTLPARRPSPRRPSPKARGRGQGPARWAGRRRLVRIHDGASTWMGPTAKRSTPRRPRPRSDQRARRPHPRPGFVFSACARAGVHLFSVRARRPRPPRGFFFQHARAPAPPAPGVRRFSVQCTRADQLQSCARPAPACGHRPDLPDAVPQWCSGHSVGLLTSTADDVSGIKQLVAETRCLPLLSPSQRPSAFTPMAKFAIENQDLAPKVFATAPNFQLE